MVFVGLSKTSFKNCINLMIDRRNLRVDRVMEQGRYVNCQNGSPEWRE